MRPPSGRQIRELRITEVAEIPNDRRIAEAYSRGEIIIQALPEYRERFTDIIEAIPEKAEVRDFIVKM